METLSISGIFSNKEGVLGLNSDSLVGRESRYQATYLASSDNFSGDEDF